MLVAFSVTPLGVGEGVAEYVADAVRVVRRKLPTYGAIPPSEADGLP